MVRLTTQPRLETLAHTSFMFGKKSLRDECSKGDHSWDRKETVEGCLPWGCRVTRNIMDELWE